MPDKRPVDFVVLSSPDCVSYKTKKEALGIASRNIEHGLDEEFLVYQLVSIVTKVEPKITVKVKDIK